MKKHTPERVHQMISATVYSIMVVCAVYYSYLNEWTSLFVTAQALIIGAIPLVLEKKFSIFTPHILRTGFIIFLFFTLVLGEVVDFYNTYWWWDLVLHTVSSAGITVIGFILITIIYRSKDLKSFPFLTSFLAFSFAICIAVIWEVYEFIIDITFKTDSPMQPSNTDTMTDLIVAIAGSLFVCLYGYRYIRKQSTGNIVGTIIEEGKLNNKDHSHR